MEFHDIGKKDGLLEVNGDTEWSICAQMLLLCPVYFGDIGKTWYTMKMLEDPDWLRAE